jgi:hypothetical protein
LDIVKDLPQHSKKVDLKKSTYSQIIYAMQCFEKRESENIKERRKIYAARDFSDKNDHALFKYQTKFVKSLIISLKRLIKFLI